MLAMMMSMLVAMGGYDDTSDVECGDVDRDDDGDDGDNDDDARGHAYYDDGDGDDDVYVDIDANDDVGDDDEMGDHVGERYETVH